jgi:hypothetical protein
MSCVGTIAAGAEVIAVESGGGGGGGGGAAAAAAAAAPESVQVACPEP